MTTDERPVFAQSMAKLVRAFRLRIKADDLEELTGTYFRILESASLSDVLAAAKSCLETRRTFPKAADWLAALPGGGNTAAVDCRLIGVDELEDYHRAERLHYEDAPCACLLCQAAGTTGIALRFVPDFTHEGRTEQAFDRVRNRVVVVGHWAHGEELWRWHAARTAFYGSVPKSSPMARALAVLVPQAAEREPGQEG